MINSPFSPWPSFTKEEADAVSQVLLSNKVNYWTGTECREFEQEFAGFAGVKHAIALANGTVALDVALTALGIGFHNGGEPKDEVIVTSRTFLASASCIVAAGAVPIFADVEMNSGNISVDTINRVHTQNTKAIIAVHLGGWPCDMDPIMAFAKKYRLRVIEDCAQAHGARYKGRSVGSIGDIGAWSFCQDKIMTTGGEGGMVTTNDHDLWSEMWSYKDHGKSWDAVYGREHSLGFRWLHESFGTNARMTEMQAKIGRLQLKKIEQWNKQRRLNLQRILQAAQKCETLVVPDLLSCIGCDGGSLSCPSGCRHAAYKCYVYVDGDRRLRDHYLDKINKSGVPCFVGSCSEIYLEKAFDNLPSKPVSRLPNAKALGDTSLMFLCHPTLTKAEIDFTCKIITHVCR